MTKKSQLAPGLVSLLAALARGGSAAAQLDAESIVGDIVRDRVEDAIGDAAADLLEDELVGVEEAAPPPPPPPRENRPPAPVLVSAATPEAVRESIALIGTAELSTDRNGAPRISGRIEGELYRVAFRGCASGDDCRSIVFSVGFAGVEASLEDVNAWNAEQIFGTAYLDDAGEPRLKMTVNLEAGVSLENLDSTVERWRIALVEFRGYVNR